MPSSAVPQDFTPLQMPIRSSTSPGYPQLQPEWLQIGSSHASFLELVNLQEWLAELKETLTFTSLVRIQMNNQVKSHMV